MATIKDLLKQLKRLREKAYDEEGWFRRGKFTPVQQIAKISREVKQKATPILKQQYSRQNILRSLFPGTSYAPSYFKGQVVEPIKSGVEMIRRGRGLERPIGAVSVWGGIASASPIGGGFKSRLRSGDSKWMF